MAAELDTLDNPPAIAFCTAYDEYAIDAFEVNAVDYLLKPIDEERLEQALNTVRDRLGRRRHRAQKDLLRQFEKTFENTDDRHNPRAQSWLRGVRDFFERMTS